jgi:hypothetical protein
MGRRVKHRNLISCNLVRGEMRTWFYQGSPPSNNQLNGVSRDCIPIQGLTTKGGKSRRTRGDYHLFPRGRHVSARTPTLQARDAHLLSQTEPPRANPWNVPRLPLAVQRISLACRRCSEAVVQLSLLLYHTLSSTRRSSPCGQDQARFCIDFGGNRESSFCSGARSKTWS